MTPIDIAKYYFDASNESNFEKIEKLFSITSTYSSQNTGLYLWIEDIVNMQKKFHWNYEKLEWKIQEIVEEKPWIVRIDFDFVWIKKSDTVSFSGMEYIVIYESKIQHIEIKNK